MDFDYAKDSKEQRPYEYYLKTYQEIDPKEISEKTGFFYDEEKKVFTVVFMGSTYEISFPDYKISHKEDEKGVYPLEEAMNAKIFMVRYLSEKAKTPSSGKFLTYREVPWGEVYFRQFQGRCLMRLAFSCGNKLEAFKKVRTAMGAKPLEQGDCAFELEFMEGFFIRLILWEGDDEFPPSSQILFSDNFAVTFAAEDLAVAGDICINMMKAVERKLS